MTTRFQIANEKFERAVKRLQENLQYLADHDKVSGRFISYQNQVIKALINYQHEVISTLEAMEIRNIESVLSESRAYHELLNAKEGLEALCIIHGIMDFPAWMIRGKNYLVAEAIEHYRKGEIQLPFKFMQIVNDFPPKDKEMFWELIYKNYKRKETKEPAYARA